VSDLRRPVGSGEGRAAFWFLLPGLSVIGLFFVLPVLGGFLLSFTDFDIYAVADPANTRFLALRNYTELLREPVFWTAVKNTFYFVLLGGPLTVAAGLAAALLVNARAARFRGFFRTVYFAPVVTTIVAVAVVWRYVFHARFGLLNHLLQGLGLPGVDWLGDPAWAMPSIILMTAWKNFGYDMIIFVAGLQSIPESLYEAARIDGAGPLQQFRSITLPMLRPTLVFVGVITMIGYFQLFAEPYVMTNGGGPLNATLSLVLHMYKEGFRWWNLGHAAAIAFLLFVVILGATVVQLRLQRERR